VAELSRHDAQINYLMVGNGVAQASLKQRASVRALPNVRFLPLQAQPQFMDLLAASNVSLITQQRVVADIVFPSKTLTFMAAGRPLIASVNPQSEIARAVKDARAGLVVEPENPSALFHAIDLMRNHEDERSAMAGRAREYARARWDRDQVLAQTATQLEALVSCSSKPESGLIGKFQISG
jgi:colanic acid biosynthesis glycosyl transferase WcaI